VQRQPACACGGGCPRCRAETRYGPIQTKLAVSQPGDVYEQEADRVAEQVMRMPAPALQRSCASCTAGGSTFPKCDEEKKALVQRKAERVSERSGSVSDSFVQNLGPGQPLDPATRSFFEPRFSHDFSQVRVHADATAAESAGAVNALAYTLGSDIVFDGGQYAPDTESGRKLLAHELAHTIQQSAAGVGSVARLQRAVRFEADFTNVTLSRGTAATITGHTFNYRDASFAADADVRAIGDTAAELADWDVGILQDEVGGWERYYWLRDKADGRGRFVEKKFLGGDARRRDQAAGATTEWDADSEHTLLSTVPPVAAGGGFEASTTVHTSDDPAGPDTTDGAAVTSMDATDGTLNIRTFRSGGQFQTWISAHNNTTGEWRHLRWINWNYMHSLDFTGSGGTLALGPESWSTGRFGPDTGGPAPLLAGDTANTVYNDAAHWSFRRVNGWT
jgi:hypothetical protein